MNFELSPSTRLSAETVSGAKRFEVIVGEELAVGGSAVVYAARDQRGRQIIIKAPRGAGRQDLSLAIEREVFRKLQAPNLPRYLGSSEPEPGQLLLLFERIYPNPLLMLNRRENRAHIRTKTDPKARYIPLPASTALELGRELILGIEALHKNGFVHCDVKLSNLMIRLDYGSKLLGDSAVFDRVRVGDYRGVLIDGGGARSHDYLEALNRGEEDPGLVAPQCTPVYAPPEVVLEPHHYGPGMDIYAAALCLYTLITGHVPYSHTQRTLDPMDLLCVWEFKQAEHRGDISPINYEVIQNAFHDDLRFADGPKQRAWFDLELHAFLQRHTQPDRERRPDISAMLKDWTALFRFTSNHVGHNHIRVAYSQGVFAGDSWLDRLREAAEGAKQSADSERLPTEAVAARAGRGELSAAQPSNFAPGLKFPSTRRLPRTARLEGGSAKTPRAQTRRGGRPADRPADKDQRRSDRSRSTEQIMIPGKRVGEQREPLIPRRASREAPLVTEGEERRGDIVGHYLMEYRREPPTFTSRFPDPILFLHETASALLGPEDKTVRIRRPGAPPKANCIFAIRPAHGRPGRSVTLGRALARDIQIPSASVSKLHAGFAVDPESGRWLLSDLGSTNGTWVDETQLTPLVPVFLENTARLIFGTESFVFYTPSGFAEFLDAIPK